MMGRCHRFVAGLLGCGLMLVGQSTFGAGWLRDVDHALGVARQQQRPMVLFVSMDGCTYCDKMVEHTLTHEQIRQQLGQQFVTVAIKGSDRPDVVRQLKIRSYPTTVLVSPQGQVLDLMVGYVSPESFHQRLQKVFASASTASTTDQYAGYNERSSAVRGR